MKTNDSAVSAKTHAAQPRDVVTNKTQQRCRTCTHWTRHTDERMANYGACAKRPVGSYTVEQSPCVITPARWSAK